MQMRELGRSGLKVSAIGLGCMGISFSYATKLSKEEGVALIRAAVERSSHSLILPKFMAPSSMKRLSVRRCVRSVTRW